MGSSFEISSFVPYGLIVESVDEFEDMIKVRVSSEAGKAACPSCGSVSQRVHSRYLRQVADLPCTGRRVALTVIARRFFCGAENCRRRIFAERFDEAVLRHARPADGAIGPYCSSSGPGARWPARSEFCRKVDAAGQQ